MKNKKAFITGISGMVGSHLLAEYLFKHTNFDIIGMIRPEAHLKISQV